MVISLVVVILFIGSSMLYGCNETEETTTKEAAEETGKMFEGQELNISGSTTVLPIATLVAEAFMEEYGGSVTISGGGSGTDPDSAVEVYDPDKDFWTRLSDLPAPRVGPGMSVVKGKIYMIGGATSGISKGHPGVKTVEVLIPDE